MSVPIDIRIQIVLLMVKFESPIVVKRKMHVEFGVQTLEVYCVRDTFQHCCETSAVVNRQRSERPSKITEEQANKVHDVSKNVP